MNERLLGSEQLIARLRAIRMAQGKSAQDIANATGITRSVITNLENRHRNSLTIDEAKKIADALGVDLLECLKPDPFVVIPAIMA